MDWCTLLAQIERQEEDIIEQGTGIKNFKAILVFEATWLKTWRFNSLESCNFVHFSGDATNKKI